MALRPLLRAIAPLAQRMCRARHRRYEELRRPSPKGVSTRTSASLTTAAAEVAAGQQQEAGVRASMQAVVGAVRRRRPGVRGKRRGLPAGGVPGEGQEVQDREEVDQRGDRQHGVAPPDQLLRANVYLDREVER